MGNPETFPEMTPEKMQELTRGLLPINLKGYSFYDVTTRGGEKYRIAVGIQANGKEDVQCKELYIRKADSNEWARYDTRYINLDTQGVERYTLAANDAIQANGPDGNFKRNLVARIEYNPKPRTDYDKVSDAKNKIRQA
jgi:hypothetical protein